MVPPARLLLTAFAAPDVKTVGDADAPLKEPVTDARALGDELRRRGFDVTNESEHHSPTAYSRKVGLRRIAV